VSRHEQENSWEDVVTVLKYALLQNEIISIVKRQKSNCAWFEEEKFQIRY